MTSVGRAFPAHPVLFRASLDIHADSCGQVFVRVLLDWYPVHLLLSCLQPFLGIVIYYLNWHLGCMWRCTAHYRCRLMPCSEELPVKGLHPAKGSSHQGFVQGLCICIPLLERGTKRSRHEGKERGEDGGVVWLLRRLRKFSPLQRRPAQNCALLTYYLAAFLMQAM